MVKVVLNSYFGQNVTVVLKDLDLVVGECIHVSANPADGPFHHLIAVELWRQYCGPIRIGRGVTGSRGSQAPVRSIHDISFEVGDQPALPQGCRLIARHSYVAQETTKRLRLVCKGKWRSAVRNDADPA